VERRLQKVEALFAELLPDLDLEDLLASSSCTLPNALPTSESIHPMARSSAQTHDGDDTFSEALPDDPDGFDWREETTEDNDMADGMASLSIEPNGVGYLGWYQIHPIQALLMPAQALPPELSFCDPCSTGRKAPEQDPARKLTQHHQETQKERR
jgi:hypothetical protein